MLTVDIFHVSSLLLVAIMFFMYELKHLTGPLKAKVKSHLVAYWLVTAAVVLASFITIEVWG